MAWTASVIGFQRDKDLFRIVVEYTDQTTTFQDPPFPCPAAMYPQALTAHVTARVKRLTQADSTTIVIGPVTLDPDPTPIPAPVELWMQQFRKLEIVYLLVQAGVIQANNQRFAALSNKLRDNMTQQIWDALGVE